MQENDTLVESGKQFWGRSSGRWAGEQFMRALAEGRPMSPAELRVAGTLRKDEWVAFDNALVEEAQLRLVGVADLIGRGLVSPVPNSMGKTMFQYEKVTNMDDANISLDGMVRGENDRVEFSLAGVPLPITHKDFFINLRTLSASREKGESLDTTQVRMAGRKIAEASETMLFLGGKTYAGITIYGYTTHPDRNTASFGTNGAWSAAAKTGQNILDDTLTLIQASINDRMYGPWVLYVSRNVSTKLDNDFKSNVSQSIRQRLMQVDGISDIKVADFLTADNVLLIQMTSDVVKILQGETLQTVQWDIEGGFGINFKAFQIQVPLIRSDAQGRSGIVHMS